jgi:hypothetical protein
VPISVVKSMSIKRTGLKTTTGKPEKIKEVESYPL